MITELARWTPEDEVIAHGLSIVVNPVEMESLMHCSCKFPAIDFYDRCRLCLRIVR